MQHSADTHSESTAQPTMIHRITRNDLPLSCPMPSASQWNAHPRVFLTLDKDGKATCPYCSTQYILKDEG